MPDYKITIREITYLDNVETNAYTKTRELEIYEQIVAGDNFDIKQVIRAVNNFPIEEKK